MNEIQISKLYFSKNKTGFTIPYLIGFEYYNSKNLMTISDFFTMILESTSETIYYLHYCPDIGEYVISKSHPTFKMKGVEILNNQRKTKLILTQSIEVLGNELDTVVKKLEQRYSNQLQEKKFSFYNRTWIEFNENEIKEMKLL